MSEATETLQIATQAHAAGDWVQAARLYTSVIENDPQHADALHHLGVLCRQVGKSNDALDLLRRALQHAAPEQEVTYRTDLAVALLADGQPAEALAQCELARAHHARSVPLLMCQAEAFREVGDLDSAVSCFQEAIECDPADIAPRQAFAELWEQAGQLDEATAQYEQILERNPKHAPTVLQLTSMMLSQQVLVEEPWLNRIRMSLLFAEDADTRIRLRFALANSLDQRSETQAAWAAYQQANEELQRELELRGPTYDAAEMDRLISRLEDGIDARDMRRWQTDGAKCDRLLLLVGLPCSGAHVLADLLACCSGVSRLAAPGPLIEEVDTWLASIGQYPESLRSLPPKAWRDISTRMASLVDQIDPLSRQLVTYDPQLSTRLGLFAALFPQAKIVHCQRPFAAWQLDTFCSPIMAGPFVDATCDLKRLERLRAQHDRLMDHWRRVLPQQQFVSVDVDTLLSTPSLIGPELCEFLGIQPPQLPTDEPMIGSPDPARFDALR